MSMQLHEVPAHTRIRVLEPEGPPPGGIPPEAKEYNFSHIDGMYSYCTDDDGNVVHLTAWTKVEIVNGSEASDHVGPPEMYK